ncbi:hypothetical protein H8M03_06040 [Sphingomonas sabuli]|uniref:Holin of 3TMs, for gene-transfer release n=1 Tax=Sphingomonas sabuli TaxID=2764186 RepID=A0A7G9L5H4_9SPHN|nr:3TM-type holin [Sphingomonas sabuli]QNM83873.1 hypothetical protein H8M03_06040 [Sphingomonas sabuli]
MRAEFGQLFSPDPVTGPLVRLLDATVADPRARDKAKLALLKLRDGEEWPSLEAELRAVAARDARNDIWTRRARPSFLYMMYALILWAIPLGLMAAIQPDLARQVADGMTSYLRGIPEELYALFGTGYLGYTAARTWGKVKGVER